MKRNDCNLSIIYDSSAEIETEENELFKELITYNVEDDRADMLAKITCAGEIITYNMDNDCYFSEDDSGNKIPKDVLGELKNLAKTQIREDFNKIRGITMNSNDINMLHSLEEYGKGQAKANSYGNIYEMGDNMDKELEFNVYEDMKNIVDSMQFSSDTIIADLVGNNIEAYIIVHGEVSVTFNDENYDDPADFPDELKQLISQEKNWNNDDRVYVSLNNWFDIVVNDRCDTDDVDIARAGTAELYSLLSYAVNEKIEAGEIQSNKLPSTLSEYIKGGGNEYLQYSYTLPKGVYETIRDMGANEKIHLDGYYNNVVLEITKDAEYDIKNLVTVKFQLDGKNIAATYNIHITELEDALTAIRNGISHRLVDESRGFAEIVADVNIETARENSGAEKKKQDIERD